MYTDFCPYVRQTAPYLCTDASKQPATAANFGGESFTAASRCFASSLVGSAFSDTNSRNAGCHEWKCSGGVLQIKAGSFWNSCPTMGGRVDAVGYRGTVTCPRWVDLCGSPTAAGRGNQGAAIK